MIAAVLPPSTRRERATRRSASTPIRSTPRFAGYRALDVQPPQTCSTATRSTPGTFDALIEQIATAEGDVIIDNGASSFVPLSHYLISNQVPALLQEYGARTDQCTPSITGGQALQDTVSGFAQLAGQFPPECQFVTWLNPYWGAIEHEGRASSR